MTQRCTKMDITYCLWSGGHGTILLWEMGSAGTHSQDGNVWTAGASGKCILEATFCEDLLLGDPQALSWPVVL